MKAKIFIILLALAVVPPMQNAHSAITNAYLLSLNVKYGDGLFQDDYFSMYAQVNTDSIDDEIYLKLPNQQEVLVPFVRTIPGSDPIKYQMLKRFIEPPPSDVWVGNYEYYWGNEWYSTISINAGEIYQLPTVGNIDISGGYNPTITWDAIDDPYILSYTVRIYKLLDNGKQDSSNWLLEEPAFCADGTCSYTYNENLFSLYEPLVFGIVVSARMATWSPPKETKVNASNYFLKHFPDTDFDAADGISDTVDVDPNYFSNQFSIRDTSGEILNRGDQTIDITKAADLDEDILITTYGGTSPARIEVCDGAGQYIMDDGDIAIVKCSSVITRVTRGIVEVIFKATDGTEVIADIPDGNILKFDQETKTLTADPNNPDTIVAYVDNLPVPIEPESDKTIDQIVQIDIKPESETNCFKQNEKGVIPVAILGREDLNVEDIDIDSLRLQGLEVKMAGKSNKFSAHYEFVNNDNFPDLVIQFEDSDQWVSSGSEYATLIGTINDGKNLIEGSDFLCIVP